jgi:hypothetical protein
MSLEKMFEDTFTVPYNIKNVWNVFSNVKLIHNWNKGFELANIECLQNQGLYYHSDKERNGPKLFLIEEVFRNNSTKIRYSIENVIFSKKNNYMEIELKDNIDTTTITFSRYLDLSVFFLRKKESVLEHYRAHHNNLISNLKTLNYSTL